MKKNCSFYILLIFFLLSAENHVVMGTGLENKDDREPAKTFITNNKRLPDENYQVELRGRAAWKNFNKKNKSWNVVFNEENGKPHRAFGSPILLNMNGSAVEKAMFFIQNELKEFNLPLADLRFQNEAISPNYHHINFYQEYKGLQVLYSRLTVKMTLDFKVVLFGTDVFDDIHISTTPSVSFEEAISFSLKGLPNNESKPFVTGELKILPIPAHHHYDFKLAYEMMVESKDQSGVPAKYYTIVDANNGDILYRDNRVKQLGTPVNIDVSGTLYTQNPYRPASVNPLKNLKIDVGTNSYFTDSTGHLSLPDTSPVVPTFNLEGPWVKVVNDQGSVSPSFSKMVLPGSNTISFDNYASLRHLSAYYHVNKIHEFMKGYFPLFTGMDISLPARIDVPGGTCNAFYTGNDIIFFSQGGSCNSLAEVSDVIYHEYGHGITQGFYKSFGVSTNNAAMDEGYADTWALCLTNNPIFGVGFYDNDSSGFIRRYDKNKKVYPKDIRAESHADGEIICGAWWDCALNLGSISKMTSLFTQTFFSLPDGPNGSEGQLYTDILIDALQVDDAVLNGGDNDITNGTPNAVAITAAFALHGITILYNTGFSHSEIISYTSNQPIPVQASLSGTPQAWAFDGIKCIYKINGSSVWDTLSLVNTSGNNWTVNIPPQAAGTLISYYLGIRDFYGNIVNALPVGVNAHDKTLPYYILVGYSLKQTENFETYAPNWLTAVPGDNATAGSWVIASPIPSYTNQNDTNSFLQTPRDYTAAGTLCALTGNGSGPTADPGSADVDGGKTTLQSPAFDLSSFINPAIEYYRCYSNNMGFNPGNDSIIVEVSGDQINWKKVESTNVTEKYWKRRVFRVKDYITPTSSTYVRFVVSDDYLNGIYNGQSLVEAAVDDFSIYDEDLNTQAETIRTNNFKIYVYPNPVSEKLFINFNLVSPSEIMADLYTLEGQKIYSMHSDIYPLGNHALAIPTSTLPQGLYLLRVQNMDVQENLKVQIIR